jgi:hypothetical protein
LGVRKLEIVHHRAGYPKIQKKIKDTHMIVAYFTMIYDTEKKLTVAFMAMASTLYTSIKKAFKASNDDKNTILEIIKIGLPAAMFATTGRPEIIEHGSKYENF